MCRWIISILLLHSCLIWANNSALLWLKQPIVRLAAVSFFLQKDSNKLVLDSQVALNLVGLLERSFLDVDPTFVASLEDYIRSRNRNYESMAEYWESIRVQGLINPLNIKTPNSEIFEKILEYELGQIENLIADIKRSSSPASEIRVAVQSLESVILTFRSALSLRDSLEAGTRSWDGVPGLNLLRKIGQDFVNPMIRATLYSSPILNKLKSELRAQLLSVREKIKSDFREMKNNANELALTELDKTMVQGMAGLDVFKPFMNVDRKSLMLLALNFFNSLPAEIKQELAWLVISRPESLLAISRSPNLFLELLNLKHPHATVVLDYFLVWIQEPKIAGQIDRLSALPLRSVAKSFAKYQRQSLAQGDTSSDALSMGLKTRRNLIGFSKGQFEFFLVSQRSDLELITGSMSLEDYLLKHSSEASFLKKSIAQLVLHNAFNSGLKTVISSEARVAYLPDGKTVAVYLGPLGNRDVHPLDSTERFLVALAQLPIGELHKTPVLQLLEGFQDLKAETKQSLESFLEEPENLRWAMQMFQLQNIVGADVFSRELKMYLLKNPKLIVTFFKNRWFSKPTANQCLMFYR